MSKVEKLFMNYQFHKNGRNIIYPLQKIIYISKYDLSNKNPTIKILNWKFLHNAKLKHFSNRKL